MLARRPGSASVAFPAPAQSVSLPCGRVSLDRLSLSRTLQRRPGMMLIFKIPLSHTRLDKFHQTLGGWEGAGRLRLSGDFVVLVLRAAAQRKEIM